MKSTLTCVAIAPWILSGCATGYGTLAGMGVGATYGAISAGVQASDSGVFHVSYVAEGLVLGALIGVVSGGIASAVAGSETRREVKREGELEEYRAWRRSRLQPAAVAPQPQSARFPTYQQQPPAAYDESVQSTGRTPLPNP
jgi:hypothetical protein